MFTFTISQLPRLVKPFGIIYSFWCDIFRSPALACCPQTVNHSLAEGGFVGHRPQKALANQHASRYNDCIAMALPDGAPSPAVTFGGLPGAGGPPPESQVAFPGGRRSHAGSRPVYVGIHNDRGCGAVLGKYPAWGDSGYVDRSVRGMVRSARGTDCGVRGTCRSVRGTDRSVRETCAACGTAACACDHSTIVIVTFIRGGVLSAAGEPSNGKVDCDDIQRTARDF